MKTFNLPTRAFVNKFIPKTKFFEKAQVNSKLQQEFSDAIVRITWAYKLAENTINISGTKNVEELQIFNMKLKNKTIPKNVLKVIDKAIPFAILYTFEFEDDFAYGITIKENAEQRYFFSEWNQELLFDFTGNTIEHIYQKTIKLFIKNKTGLTVKNQNFEELLEKEKKIATLEKEISTLQKKVRTEKQFNKQVAFNKALKSKQKEKENLQNDN
ncbi:DUF4391 domain-containing protein [Polaribacter sargassicola]|uniref:DUF4391 domain-containing protein n=1 Tax=Polaribacter sargassicola TaxID=2836891 RepID=UPI001F1E1710|nr:DUF4391 domain-containing protein [Polaribacter sp. DS7-9]MCG1037297.1 DUF4391 domain-containing protein [Polaribacter sp. DS7-9]